MADADPRPGSNSMDDAPPGAGHPPASQAASYSAVLRNRNFALIWFGQTVSEIGNGAYVVALGWTVYAVTRSSADLGIVLAANAIPQILLFMFGGVLGDRLPRRTVILVADATAGVITAVLALLAATSGLTFGVLLAGSALMGVTGAIYDPAYGAIVPDVLLPDQVLRGNALLSASGNLARVFGPLIGGALYALGGASLAFGFDAASFAVSTFCMAVMTVPSARAIYEGTVLGDIAEGVGYAARTRWLQLVIIIGLVANLTCVAPLLVLLPAIVKRVHGGPGSLGLATAAQMVAAMAAALLIPRIPRIGRAGASLTVLAGVLALGVIIVGLSRSLAVLLIGMAIIGVGFGFNVVESTIVQSLVPRTLLSRVYSLMLAVSFALLPVGYAASGVLAQKVGLTAVMCSGGACLAAVVLGAAFSRSLRTLTATGAPAGEPAY